MKHDLFATGGGGRQLARVPHPRKRWAVGRGDQRGNEQTQIPPGFQVTSELIPKLSIFTGSCSHGEADSGLGAGRQEAPPGGLPEGQRRQHHLRRRPLLGAAERSVPCHQRPGLVIKSA